MSSDSYIDSYELDELEYSMEDSSSIEGIIDLQYISNNSNINESNICKCRRITECSLECVVCGGKCCIFCTDNTIDYEICEECQIITKERELQLRKEIECDEIGCGDNYVYKGNCQCRDKDDNKDYHTPQHLQKCDRHLNKCGVVRCKAILCNKNRKKVCNSHNNHCIDCRNYIKKNKKSTSLTNITSCNECCCKTCFHCTKKRFPLLEISNEYRNICKDHYKRGKCLLCDKQSMTICSTDGCDEICCHSLRCNGYREYNYWSKQSYTDIITNNHIYEDIIHAYCWECVEECNSCSSNTPKEWMRRIENNVYNVYNVCIGCYDRIGLEYKLMCLIFNRSRKNENDGNNRNNNYKSLPKDIRNILLGKLINSKER